MDISTIVAERITIYILDTIKDKLPSLFTKSGETIVTFQDSISRHLVEVDNWSRRIEGYGWGSAHPTDSTSISLRFYTTPIRYRNNRKSNSRARIKKEASIFHDNENYLIIGDPGSGKTTTLKRLARIMLSEDSVSHEDLYQYPMVFRLRELDLDISFVKNMAKKIGVGYTDVYRKDKEGKILKDKYGKAILEKTLVGNVLIDDAIPDLLNTTNAILMLDGLDEIPTDRSPAVLKDIEILARKLSTSKIIMTCRSGAYVRNIEGFDVLEVCPLEKKEVAEIAAAWLDEPELFLKHLKEVPYADIANRPLLLVQLLLLFNKSNYLPDSPLTDSPSLVYRKTTKLLLEEWDKRRNIKRKSKYAFFDPDTKGEFLSELAYLLTFKIKTKRFTEDDLEQCYSELYKSFRLPKNEGLEVAKEIETHSGIVVQTGEFHYEFSHLSLQEYLCANYLVKSITCDDFTQYISEYSAPLAVSVSLSSDPSNWFASLFLKESNFKAINEKSLISFLSRLILERPRFKDTMPLGMAILKLFSTFYRGDEGELDLYLKIFLDIQGIKEAFVYAIGACVIDTEHSSKSDCYYLELDHNIRKDHKILEKYDQRFIRSGKFPKKIFVQIVKEYNTIPLLWKNKEGRLEVRPIK